MVTQDQPLDTALAERLAAAAAAAANGSSSGGSGGSDRSSDDHLPALDEDDAAIYRSRIVELLLPGENVLAALRRLGALVGVCGMRVRVPHAHSLCCRGAAAVQILLPVHTCERAAAAAADCALRAHVHAIRPRWGWWCSTVGAVTIHGASSIGSPVASWRACQQPAAASSHAAAAVRR
jgi:hypothetical protein